MEEGRFTDSSVGGLLRWTGGGLPPSPFNAEKDTRHGKKGALPGSAYIFAAVTGCAADQISGLFLPIALFCYPSRVREGTEETDSF